MNKNTVLRYDEDLCIVRGMTGQWLVTKGDPFHLDSRLLRVLPTKEAAEELVKERLEGKHNAEWLK